MLVSTEHSLNGIRPADLSSGTGVLYVVGRSLLAYRFSALPIPLPSFAPRRTLLPR